MERLQPTFFVLENVPGMKHHRVDLNVDIDVNMSSIRNFAQAALKRLIAAG